MGVNFLGFKASAGLGGLLTGNAADGGLGASAETPFGQRAGAGLGGVVDGNGNSQGYKYHYHQKRFSTYNQPREIVEQIVKERMGNSETSTETTA